MPDRRSREWCHPRKKLESFRESVKNKLCKFYASPADLGAKVSRSITQLKKQWPKPGWIRAEILDSLTSSDEVLQLKRENEELRNRLIAYGLQEPDTKKTLASGSEHYELDVLFTREAINQETGRFRKKAEQWTTALVTWDEMFSRVGVDLVRNNRPYWSPASVLANLAQAHAMDSLTDDYPNERFGYFRVSSTCIDTVLMQFRALKLIEIDGDKSWRITPYGDNYLASLVGVPKGKTKRDI